MVSFKENTIIIEAGTPGDTFYIIAEGNVDAIAGGKHIPLKKGDIIGIFDLVEESHICTYVATSPVNAMPYQFVNTKGLLAMLEKQADLRKLLLSSLNRNINALLAAYKESIESTNELYTYLKNMHSQYQELCLALSLNAKTLPFEEELSESQFTDELPFWMLEYYADIRKILTGTQESASTNFVYGYLERAGADIADIVSLLNQNTDMESALAGYLLGEDSLDYYDLFTDLYFRARTNNCDLTIIGAMIASLEEKIRSTGLVDEALIADRTKAFTTRSTATTITPGSSAANDTLIASELENSLSTILEYADSLPTTAAEFRKAVEAYIAVPDRSSTEKEVDLTRKQIVKLFYVIYNDCMQSAVKSSYVPTIIKMFLNFGFVDAKLCGMDNAISLYKLTESFKGDEEKGIYTTLEWFKCIYEGKKMPSRNEFEQDYTMYVRSLFKEGKITKEGESQMLDDPNERVLYELNNMFPSVNKITFGRILTFCPVLTEENLIREPESILLTADKINDIICKYNEIDYSAFYHEMIYEDTSIGIKDTIRIDIRPDIILMPNVGTRGVLWQEIEGMNRKTPGRMVMSSLFVDNLDKAVVRMFAEFRWEMCKRDQGARWNDVTIHSLTSDYCDYAQFFQKNRDISFDTKEKIKETLKKCKNSYKEMFIYDYTLYMMFEANGSCRLNKTVRYMIFLHCPLGKAFRERIAGNTIFEDCLSKHRVTTGQQLHRLDQIEARYNQNGKDMPLEFATQRELIER